MLFSAVKRIESSLKLCCSSSSFLLFLFFVLKNYIPPLRTALTIVTETLMTCKPTAVTIFITRFFWLDNPVKTEVYLVYLFTVSFQQSFAKPGFEPVYHLTYYICTYTHNKRHRCLNSQISIPYPSRSNLRLNSVFVSSASSGSCSTHT